MKTKDPSDKPKTKINGSHINVEALKYKTTKFGRVYKELDVKDKADQELLLYGHKRDQSRYKKLPEKQRRDEVFLQRVMGQGSHIDYDVKEEYGGFVSRNSRSFGHHHTHSHMGQHA